MALSAPSTDVRSGQFDSPSLDLPPFPPFLPIHLPSITVPLEKLPAQPTLTHFPLHQNTAINPHHPRTIRSVQIPHLHHHHRLDPRHRPAHSPALPPSLPTQTRPRQHRPRILLSHNFHPTTHSLPMRDRARHHPRQRALGAPEAQHRAALGNVELGDAHEDGGWIGRRGGESQCGRD